MRVVHAGVAAIVAILGAAAVAAAGTVPPVVAFAVHGRVFGWAQTGSTGFAVYVDRRGGDWCGLSGASWRMTLVPGGTEPSRVTADRRIGGAMCGNELAWVRGGRFSDGRHAEAAFIVWTTPSIGATTYLYHVDGGGFQRLALFGGDRVTLGTGTVKVGFENPGRSPHGELEDLYRFEAGHYRLVRRR